MNVIRVADSVLFLTSVSDSEIDIEHLMACIIGQGIPPNPTLTVVDLHRVAQKVRMNVI